MASRAVRVAALVAGALAAGTVAGVLMRFAGDLAGTPLPPAAGWARPSPQSPEGRLFDRLARHPRAFAAGELFECLGGAAHPAVRDLAARQLAGRLAGTGDREAARRLVACLKAERDPAVAVAIRAALRTVAGEDAGLDAVAWEAWLARRR